MINVGLGQAVKVRRFSDMGPTFKFLAICLIEIKKHSQRLITQRMAEWRFRIPCNFMITSAAFGLFLQTRN